MVLARVERTSKEMIKPSFPTPHHLRNLKLSFLDQITPAVFIPLIFFYQTHNQFASSYQSLKQFLSDVLTQFYPLAGRLSGDNHSVDCDDSGVLYVEAKVLANLVDVIKEPNMEEWKTFLPIQDGKGEVLLALQVNIFDCESIAIAVQMSHKIGDGTSLVNFMNALAATCRDDNHVLEKFSPKFDTADLFLPKTFPSDASEPFSDVVTKEKVITKRFVFDKKKLTFWSTSCGEGIEAWVNILEKDESLFKISNY